MPTGALPATVAVEFGFGSPPGAISPTWTDVSAYVDMSAGIAITPGRTAERSSISPRRLAFLLDNRDGRFNPRNAAGPYYGNLKPRVPVRVRVTYSATTYTLFRGFVDGGWPQDYVQLSRTVPMNAVDAVGWAAAAPPPRSAFEGEVQALQDDENAELLGWIRAQSDGFTERLSGTPIPAAFALEKLDPLVDGDEEGAWGSKDDALRAASASPAIAEPVFTSGSPGLLTFWVRALDENTAYAVSVGRGTVDSEGAKHINVLLMGPLGSTPISVRVWHGNSFRWDRVVPSWMGGVDHILDGADHFVCYWCNGSSMAIWIDGEHVPAALYTAGTWVLGDVEDTVIGYGSELRGAVDHVTWWTNADEWDCSVGEAVTRLYAAGRLARVGDSMDARMSWLLNAVGWDLVGTLDPSTTTTQQGYRRRNTILDLLQTIEDTEQGRVWVDNEGRFRFSHRTWPHTNPKASTVQATFGDTGSDLPYSAELSRIVDDDRQVVNVAEVNREYGTQQRAENAASIATYGRRQPVTLSNLLYSNDRQSKAVADWLVATHGEPKVRVEVLTFSPLNESATLCPLAAQIEPGWLIRTKRDGLTFDAHVVDVGHRIGLTSWDVSLNLDATRATDMEGFTWDDGTGTVGTPWDDGTGTVSGAKGWVF